MSPQSRTRPFRRLTPLAAALLLAALLAVPSSGTVLAQAPPGDGIVLVNADRDFVERKKKGEFIARPIFDREIEDLFYAVRDADTGDWITTMYHVKARAKRLSEGWEYSWEYPAPVSSTGQALEEQPELDPETPFLLVILASGGGESGAFHAVIPIYEPSKIWDRILVALSPARWAKAFAGWVIEGSTGRCAEWSSGRPATTPTSAGEGRP